MVLREMVKKDACKMSFYFVCSCNTDHYSSLWLLHFWLIWMRMTLFMWQQLQHLSIRIPIFSINPYTGYSYTRSTKQVCFVAVSDISCSDQFSCRTSSGNCGACDISCSLYFYGISGSVSVCETVVSWTDEHARGIFMIFCAVLIWFSAYSVYNSENFQMIRIWQGKACLASVFLPLLLYLGIGIILEKEQEYSWLLLLLADISCCLLSSMGIILACMMLVILLIMGLVRFHSLQKAACTALCCLPSLLLGLVYIMIR